MSKQIAILKYTIIFDPSEAYSNGFQFENAFGKFFQQAGLSANIVESLGGTGERVIFLTPSNTVGKPTVPEKAGKPASEQIRQVQQKTPPKSFKKFIQRENRYPNQQQPKPTFGVGKTLRKKVRMP